MNVKFINHINFAWVFVVIHQDHMNVHVPVDILWELITVLVAILMNVHPVSFALDDMMFAQILEEVIDVQQFAVHMDMYMIQILKSK